MKKLVSLLFFLAQIYLQAQTVNPVKPLTKYKIRKPAKYSGIYPDTFSLLPKRNFKNYTTKDGLSQMNIKKLFFDRNGRMWVGTYGGGINVFDGDTQKIDTSADGLLSNYIKQVYHASAEEIWIATNNGISLFDGTRFNNITTNEGLRDNRINTIIKDK